MSDRSGFKSLFCKNHKLADKHTVSITIPLKKALGTASVETE